ncbi:nitroreductase family protein [Tissierellaceae bacterium HCP3S3_D8]
MDIIEGIMTRTSIRKFTGEIIDKQQLDTLLKAGFQAPTAHNFQPWEFIVVQDREILQEIKNFHKYAKMVMDAGAAIIVCGDMVKQRNRGFLTCDTSAAIQNMLLAAHGLGLGAVWCGIYDKEELVDNMRKTLQLPENILPVGMVVVGNKKEDRTPIDRYDENKIHYNRW